MRRNSLFRIATRAGFASTFFRTILLLALISSLGARGLHGSTASKYAKFDGQVNSVKNREKIASEETTRQMLNVLGMDELPKPRHGVITHQYMIQIYEQMSKRNPDEYGVNTIRGFVDVGNDDSKSKMKFHQIYAFNISALPNSEKIISADLRLLRIAMGSEWKYAWAHGTKYRAKLYYRKSVNHVWNSQVFTHTQLMLLDSAMFDIRDKQTEDWKVFKVLDALRQWQNDSNFVHNFELQVESVRTGYLMPAYTFGLTEGGRPHYKRALLVSFSNDGRVRDANETNEINSNKRSKRNKIVVKSEEESTNRIKRSTKRRKRRKPLCNRKKLYVDFTLLGWSEWIIAPRGYNAYYCQGICKYPIPEHLKPTNHAMVQTTVHYTHGRRVPPACCVPHKLSGISMLFLDKGDSVVYKKYDNMVVESCGCK